MSKQRLRTMHLGWGGIGVGRDWWMRAGVSPVTFVVLADMCRA
jgi:hypothetical protein